MNIVPSLPAVDIARKVEMSHSEFSSLTAKEKWYYFYLVHYGPNCLQIQYLLRHK